MHSHRQETETLPFISVNIKVLYIHSDSQEIETLPYNSISIRVFCTYIARAKRLKQCLIILLTLRFCTYITRTKRLKHCLIMLLTLRLCTYTAIAKRLKHCLLMLLTLRPFYIRSESQEIQDNGDALHDDFLQLSSSEHVVPTVWTLQETMNNESGQRQLVLHNYAFFIQTHERFKRTLFMRTIQNQNT